jgi:hypothetical protein
MEWDKFSEKALLKLLPFFLIIKSVGILIQELFKKNESKT